MLDGLVSARETHWFQMIFVRFAHFIYLFAGFGIVTRDCGCERVELEDRKKVRGER